ncbi:UNVERIFIED_CONTAM: Subtilisin-like protease SBT1.9 [Sesamum radiatum]|uniref:Subtilisin-like protease SBT1.9 n=1 Tax=Sesamum radiatum TaxID=300843 RepID=A0AAW2JWJ0_SESRA
MDLSAMPKAFSSQHTWYLTILSSISDSTKPTTTSNFVYAYTNAVNDFSAILSSSELNAIKDLPRQRGAILETLHNGMPWVLNVDASTIDREFQGTLSLGNGASAIGLSLYLGNSSPIEFPIVYVGACENEDSLKKVGHKIAVCLEMSNTLSEQLYYVSNANVLGGVFIYIKNTYLMFFDQTPFPTVFFTLEESQKIQDYIKSDPMPKASFKFQEIGLGTKLAPKLASYSSRGPSQSCPFVLKPDIMASGDLILAS